MEITTHICHLIRSLPNDPGVYQFYDKKGTILYVGKAKSLKKRVSSYFMRSVNQTAKTRRMVEQIDDIRIVVVMTELDALLLENTLIKKYQPRYNVLLKDDKTYPWICIKNEPFSRVFATRNRMADNSLYFGPYPSGKMMHTLIDLCHQLFPIRTCSLALTLANIKAGKFKSCLEYQIGNCKAPCIGLQDETAYDAMIQQVKEILKGNIQYLIQTLKMQMQKQAQMYAFEEAQKTKEKIAILEKYKSKSIVAHPSIRDVDVFSCMSEQHYFYVHYLRVIGGLLVHSFTLDMKVKLDEPPEQLLSMAIFEIRQKFNSQSPEIIVPFKPDLELEGLHYTVPSRGDKKALLDLASRNLSYYLREKVKQIEIKDPESHTKRILETLKKDLRLKDLPTHIECFDNSNFQGDYAVSAMVCFRDAKPSKKDYRHFNVKTVKGANDFDTMNEAVTRHYKRVLDEQLPLPQLLVIDGGKGQLSAAVEALEQLGISGRLSVIGIAKRLEEIYYPNDSLPLYLDKKSESLKVLQSIRNEAHRFGITHYRKRHEKGLIKTELEQIKGIGKTTAELLLTHFRSVDTIKEASEDDIAELIGHAKARLVIAYFNTKTEVHHSAPEKQH